MTDYLSLRVNVDLKDDFYTFCKSKGFTAGKAIKLFARHFIASGELPFSLARTRAYPDGNLKRISIHMDAETRQLFAAACDKYGLDMSVVVRGFMDYCVSTDCFPYDTVSSKKSVK